MSLEAGAVQGQSMSNPVSSESTFDQVYEEISVPCPTCRGTGRISRDEANLQDLVSLATEVKKSVPPALPIDKEIFSRIRDEMKSAGVSQEIFAAVAFNRTQGLLSEILRQGNSGVNLEKSRCLRENLGKIEAFLNKPQKERRRMYAEYRQKSKSQHRLYREYYDDVPSSGRRVFINAHAKGVLNEFSQRVSSNPDKVALRVLSEALDIQKGAILKYLRKIKEQNSQADEGAALEETTGAATSAYYIPENYLENSVNDS